MAGAGFAIIGCVATDPTPRSPSSGGASARASATAPAGSSTTLGPADLGATAPDARSPITSAVTTQIRTLIASTLEPGRLELDAGAAPHGVSIGVRVPGEPDLLLAAGTDAADPTTAFDARTTFRAGFVTEVIKACDDPNLTWPEMIELGIEASMKFLAAEPAFEAEKIGVEIRIQITPR